MYGCSVARNHLHWSTFSFSESRTAFSFAGQKKKWFWPQPGGQKSDFPRKGYAPSVRRRSTHRAPAVSKRHSRQETACPQRLGCGPCRQAFTNLIIKIHQTIMVTHVRIVSGSLCNYRPKDKWLVISLLTAFFGIPPAPVGCPGRSGRG